LLDQDLESNRSSFSTEDLGFSVPQVTPHFPQLHRYIPQPGLPSGFSQSKEASKMKVSWEWSEDGLTVPQISPRSVKKSRHFHSRLFDQFFNCKTSSLFRCPMQCFFNGCPLLFSVWFLVFLWFCDIIIKSSDINSVKFLNFLW